MLLIHKTLEMNKNRALHQPFTKPFWKLLSFSILSVLLVYGGIVWAVSGDTCTEYSNGNEVRVGGDVSNISGWTVVRKICQKVINDGTPDDIVVKTSNVDNKTIRLTNTGTKDYFVPTRTDTELNSFLNASLPFSKCEVGLNSSNVQGRAWNNVIGCEDTQNCPSYCVGTWSTGGSGSCDGTYELYYPGDTCSGTYDITEKKDYLGNAFNWQSGVKYFVLNVAHNGLISGVAPYTNGSNPGNYDIASSGGTSACRAYYVNQSNQWVYDAYPDETDQFDTRCLYAGSPYSTGNTGGVTSAPYVTVSTNNSCTNVPLDQCATNQYYDGCILNDSYTTTSCGGLDEQNCGTYQETSTCTWNGTQGQTFNCNTQNTESACQQYNSNVCVWKVSDLCLNFNGCLDPTVTQSECNSMQACSWSSTNSSCQYDSQGCYSETTELNCDNTQGCAWYKNQYCIEDNFMEENFFIDNCYLTEVESTCNALQGCFWDGYCQNDL